MLSLSTPCSTSSAIALDSCLHVVRHGDDDDDQEGESSVSAVLRDGVDCLAWSPCERFVLAGLRGGHVQVVHLKTRRPLPALQVAENGAEEEEGKGGGPFFVHCQFQDDPECPGQSVRLIGSNAKVDA